MQDHSRRTQIQIQSPCSLAPCSSAAFAGPPTGRASGSRRRCSRVRPFRRAACASGNCSPTGSGRARHARCLRSLSRPRLRPTACSSRRRSSLGRGVARDRDVRRRTSRFKVSALRKALGADRDVIRTEFGRGYRFTGLLRTNNVTGASQSPDAAKAAALPNFVFTKLSANTTVQLQFEPSRPRPTCGRPPCKVFLQCFDQDRLRSYVRPSGALARERWPRWSPRQGFQTNIAAK